MFSFHIVIHLSCFRSSCHRRLRCRPLHLLCIGIPPCFTLGARRWLFVALRHFGIAGVSSAIAPRLDGGCYAKSCPVYRNGIFIDIASCQCQIIVGTPIRYRVIECAAACQCDFQELAALAVSLRRDDADVRTGGDGAVQLDVGSSGICRGSQSAVGRSEDDIRLGTYDGNRRTGQIRAAATRCERTFHFREFVLECEAVCRFFGGRTHYLRNRAGRKRNSSRCCFGR